MREKLIKHVRRDIILDSHFRYGLARNMPANDDHGHPVLLCLAIVERDNGAFEVVAINEAKIQFHGEGIIEEEILRRVYA